MAGVKGRSGGPRANAGGARPGAGRPKKPKEPPVSVEADDKDMLTLLQDIALGRIDVTNNQLRAAIAAGRSSNPAKPADGLLTAPHDHPIMDTLSVR